MKFTSIAFVGLVVSGTFGLLFSYQEFSSERLAKVSDDAGVVGSSSCMDRRTRPKAFCETEARNFGCPTEYSYILGVPVPGTGRCGDNIEMHGCTDISGIMFTSEEATNGAKSAIKAVDCANTRMKNECFYTVWLGCHAVGPYSIVPCPGGIDVSDPDGC